MEKGGGSRLLQMQARFQQKQMQEREMKIASLYEAQQTRALDRVRHSPSNGVAAVTSPPPTSHNPEKVRMQERELEIASLYEAQQARALDRVRHSPSNGVGAITTGSPPAPQNPGKVRQMFEERRTKAGIDKSYPLQPIHNTERTARKALPNGYSKVTTASTNARVSVEKRTTKTKTHITVSSHSVKKQQHKIENLVNGSGDLNHNHEPDLNSAKLAIPECNGEVIPTSDETDAGNNNGMLEDETFPDALVPSPSPSPAPDTPQHDAHPRHASEPHKPAKSPPPKTSPAKTKSRPPAVTPPRRVTSENVVSETSKTRGGMQRVANPVTRRRSVKASAPVSSTVSSPRGRGGATAASVSSGAGGTGGAAGPGAGGEGVCAVCGRHFAPDRVAKHQEICKKAHTKKRKPFDALKHRLAGTEAEPFIGKLRKTNANPSKTKVGAKPLNSNWRQKHEEFIQAIRAAKQVQAHLSAGGKLSDLPPPPPSENPDYVQCPHCSRRFNSGAAERHIPKCASYQFNKPKPAARRR